VDLSVVVPIYNEEGSVKPLCEAIRGNLDRFDYEWETVLVDDGSKDSTFHRAYEIARNDHRFRIIKLNKNSGQTAALYAGFEHANGDIIITMDGDLQNDPDDIKRLLDKMQEGYEVVTGWREDRKDQLFLRKIPSRIANWLIRKSTQSPIIDNGCALRAYRADVIKKFPLYSEMHRLLPTILSLAGVRIAQIKVKHHPRQFGASKYGLSRIYKVLFDLVALKTVMTSVRLPLFGFGSFAFLSAVLGVLFLIGGLANYTFQHDGSLVIYIGSSMLWGALSIVLIMFGILCTLIYSRGDLKIEKLLSVRKI